MNVAVEERANRLAQASRAVAVNDAHFGQAGERRAVEERVEALERRLDRRAEQQELGRRIVVGDASALRRSADTACQP